MTTALFEGIVSHSVVAERLTAHVLERPAEGDASSTVVFVHGNVSSSLFWQPNMLALPGDVRALAIDLRGFGGSEILPIDATRGVRDFSDDVASVLDALGVRLAHFVGWSMGGGVVLQFLLDHPKIVQSVTLVSPVSPYGFGGTAGADGRQLNDECAGTGGGGANPDFIARLDAHDMTDEAQTSPRSVYRSGYVADHAPLAEHEDLWVESMLTTATGPDNYPGDSVAAENWPGFGPGTRGVLNTMVPKYFNVSGIVDLEAKPDILWVHGANDAIVSDTSFYDLNYLGQLGVIPGWPGEDAAPAQPMVTQTRAVLDAYAAAGGRYAELSIDGAGHSAHLERADLFDPALAAQIDGTQR